MTTQLATSSVPFQNLHVLSHPLIQHKLSIMRKEETSSPKFRKLLRELTLLMGYEITRDLPTREEAVQTPVAPMMGTFVEGEEMAVVPILRAGLGMSEALMELVPEAVTGHIGVYRDPETKRPVEYLVKLPDPKDRLFVLVDPMIATGHSAAYSVEVLLKHGVKVENIRFLALVCAPEGVKVFSEQYPEIPIYTAALDEKLNEKAYIVPGLGDAGDRIFGTL